MTEGLSCTDCSTPFPAGVKKPRRRVLRCVSCREILHRKRSAEWSAQNPERKRARDKAYHAQNPEKAVERTRAWRLKHPGRRGVTDKARYAQNLEKEHARKRTYRALYPEKHRAYITQRRKTDPKFRLRAYLRTRLYYALRGKDKSEKTLELLGCPIPDLMTHLELLFKPGMTWKNYGPVWHVDHKRPCAAFDLSLPAQQRICFHFSNLQPLFAEENLRKGAKV